MVKRKNPSVRKGTPKSPLGQVENIKYPHPEPETTAPSNTATQRPGFLERSRELLLNAENITMRDIIEEWKIIFAVAEIQELWGKLRIFVMALCVQIIMYEWKNKFLLLTSSLYEVFLVFGFVSYTAGAEIMFILARCMTFYFVGLLNQAIDNFINNLKNERAPLLGMFYLLVVGIVYAVTHGSAESYEWFLFCRAQGYVFVLWYYKNTIFAIAVILRFLLRGLFLRWRARFRQLIY